MNDERLKKTSKSV